MSAEQATSYAFQAEVQQLLDIVINSLYTDKEIFVRELVSNASDALEKMRRTQLTERDVFDDALPLEINITTDDTANTFTIADYGIGMTRDEVVENIGTIAHSGSKQFLKALTESDQKESNLIGKFGVGFYSSFMVSDDVKVYTHSWKEGTEDLCWASDGKTGYTIEEAPGQRRGCKIVIKLKEGFKEYAKEYRIKSILETYSSFVPFAINLNGERVNKIEALWLKNKNEVSDEDYSAFYKFIAHAHDEPAFRMHFSTDAPLSINALIFTPKENPEKMLSGPVDPGVSLYC
ncbi:MAG: ATP-binding protein, partial [Verrucomicrobiales bacterium]